MEKTGQKKHPTTLTNKRRSKRDENIIVVLAKVYGTEVMAAIGYGLEKDNWQRKRKRILENCLLII